MNAFPLVYTLFVVTLVLLFASAWWKRHRKAAPTGAYLFIAPSSCAKCGVVPLLQQYEPKEPLGDNAVLMCACPEDAWWRGRNTGHLIEEWNETQRVARGGAGTERDVDR